MAPPEVPREFWDAGHMRDALSSRHMGRVIYAYRSHPWHGRPLSQDIVGGWLHLSQTQLSRIENGPALEDLGRLIRYAEILSIPDDLLWFKLPGDNESSGAAAGYPPVRRWTRREIRALREAARLSLIGFAERLGISDRVISKWESGTVKNLRPDSQAILDTFLSTAPDDVRVRFFSAIGAKPDEFALVKARSLGSADDLDGEARKSIDDVAHATDSITQIALLPALHQIELLRQEVSDMFRGAMSEASLDEWDRMAIRYARATRNRAPRTLLDDISQDLGELIRLMRDQRSASAVRRLTRVSAQMSGLMCLVFCLLDDRQSFRKWARTASLAGNEAGDPEILSWVLAQEAYGHYYSGDITEALDVARHANEVVSAPCTGVALASALEARASALTGRGTETRNALARTESILSQLDGDVLIPSAFGYNEASFRFHEGSAYTHLGDFKSAMRAQDRALELCEPDNYADWAMTRLDRAQCLICTGEVTGGLEYAAETIETLIPAHYMGIITLRGQDILNKLPKAERKRTAARDFHELLIVAAQNSEV